MNDPRNIENGWEIPSEGKVRISYPDFIEDGGRIFVTETQKSVARVHEVPPWLLARLWEDSHA